jgi:RNA:NAD 2'-phosphotransferase (TPT1/KptA family)
MSRGSPNDPNVKSGARKDSTVFIKINMEEAMKDGIVFYLSENNVILSRGPIPPKYLSLIDLKDIKPID